MTPPELSGATFTVSNLGMFGMTAITPVINPPQAAILGVGAARELPALVDGELVQRHLLTLTLSCDHRILYGADAARFLTAIRDEPGVAAAADAVSARSRSSIRSATSSTPTDSRSVPGRIPISARSSALS